MYIPNACGGSVFHAVRLRQFVHSSRLGARLWLNNDLKVNLDGHPDDARTIWPLEHGYLLPNEHDLFSKLHPVLSLSLFYHGHSVMRLKQF